MTDLPDTGTAPTTVATDAGMIALWSPAAFPDVVDHPSWERELLEEDDLLRHVAAGALVPVNIRSDGAFGLVLRTGSAAAPAALTAREAAYLVVSSEAYLFRSRGQACLSGIERVGADPWPGTLQVSLAPGDWSVAVHLIDWTAEPGAALDGSPTPDALADFVLLADPAPAPTGPFRTALDTFDLADD